VTEVTADDNFAGWGTRVVAKQALGNGVGVGLGLVKTWVENPMKRNPEFASDRRRKLDLERRKWLPFWA